MLRQPKGRFRVSSNEGNLLRSEKTNKENQYRFALGACARYHTLSLSCIGNYNVTHYILSKVISKFVFKNRRSSGVKRIDRLVKKKVLQELYHEFLLKLHNDRISLAKLNKLVDKLWGLVKIVIIEI